MKKLFTGEALMLAARDFTTGDGAVTLKLSTEKNNLTAQSLYEKLGFERDEEPDFFDYKLKGS